MYSLPQPDIQYLEDNIGKVKAICFTHAHLDHIGACRHLLPKFGALVPIYASAMSAASGGYGVVTEVYAWTALLLVILTYGMETTFFRFVNKEEEHVIVKLEEPLPADTPVGVFVSNATAKPKLTIKDTTVRGNRARGFLIQTSKALVENCKFDSISGPAILVECDGSFWFEGATTSDLTVKNSTFKNCDIWSGASRTAILADAPATDGAFFIVPRIVEGK